jgi:hypothetical protein
MGMVSLIDMAADRGVHLPEPEFELVGGKPQLQQPDVHAFYGWSKGLKTGIYYLRRKGTPAQQFTIEPEKKPVSEDKQEPCEMCSS